METKLDSDGFEVEIDFNEEGRRNYNSYLNSIFYFTLVSNDDGGVPVKCTINSKSEFVHEIPVIRKVREGTL